MKQDATKEQIMEKGSQELHDFVNGIAANCTEKRLIEMGWLIPRPMKCFYCDKPFKTMKPLETHEGYCRRNKSGGTEIFIGGLEGKPLGYNI